MKKPLSVSIVLGLIVLSAVLWAVFGLIVAINVHPALPDQPVEKALMAVASFILAGVLIFLWTLLSKQDRRAYLPILLLLGAITLAALLDDVGWVDLAFMGLCILEVGLLIKERKWFLARNV